MFKWPMRGHSRYLRFKTFPMTSRTPQCEVFWALLSNPKHSGGPEDSKSPTLGVLGFTPTLGQSGVTTSPQATRTHKTHHGQHGHTRFTMGNTDTQDSPWPKLGEATIFPLIVYSAPLHGRSAMAPGALNTYQRGV